MPLTTDEAKREEDERGCHRGCSQTCVLVIRGDLAVERMQRSQRIVVERERLAKQERDE